MTKKWPTLGHTVTLVIQSHGGISSSKTDRLYTGFGVEQNIEQRLSLSKGAVVQIFLKTKMVYLA